MPDHLKRRLISGWGLMRFIRLALALGIMIRAVSTSKLLFGVLGAVLLLQAVFNYGCCGADTCDIKHNTRNRKSSGKTEDVITFKLKKNVRTAAGIDDI
jgi:hypothetical protein